MKKIGTEHLLDDVVAVLMRIVTTETPTLADFDRELAVALKAHDDEHETDVLASVISETRFSVVWDTSPKQLARDAIAAVYDVPPLGKAGDSVEVALARVRKGLS
jgi:hypothetical protein